MMRKVRAILIDPFDCTVTDVEIDASDHRTVYPQLSHEVHPVRSIALAYCPFLQVGEAIYVDRQGSLESSVRFFRIAGCEPPLAGKGLILGTDEKGNTIGASSSLALITAAVMFAELRDGQLIPTYGSWERRKEV